MKKSNFNKRLTAVTTEAREFIENKIVDGKEIVFLTQEEIEKDDTAIHDVPRLSSVGKHGDYQAFGITSIKGLKDGPVLTCYNDDIRIFFEIPLDALGNAYLDDQDLCFLADLIEESF